MLFRCAMVVAVMGSVARADVFDFVKETAPGKWIEQVAPEADQARYPGYFNELDKARQQAFTGKFRRALGTLGKLKERDDADIALLKGICLHALGRTEEALKALQGNDARVEVMRARVLSDLGQGEEATELLRGHLRKHPNSLAGHFWLGQVSEQLGDLAAARRAYGWFVEEQKFLDKWVGDVPGAFEKAEEVTLIGRAIDRWACLNGAYENNTALHNTILNIFVKAYDQIDRGCWPAHVAAGEYFLSHDDRKEAAKEIDAALEVNEHDVRALSAGAEIALSTFNFDAVEQVIRKMRFNNPQSVTADLWEARNLLQQRRPKDAQLPVRRVLEKQPRNLEALGLLAATHALQLEDEQTKEALKRVEKLDPDNATAYFEVAEQLGAMRQYPRSAEMYRIAIERAPWWTAPRNGLGLLYTQSGDEDLARATLDAAHNLDPFNLATTNYLRLLDDLAKFARKETEHFVIMYDSKSDPVIPEYFAQYLESVYREVCGEFGAEPPVKTYIEVFPTHEGFSVRTTGSPWIGTVGASTGRVIALCAPRDGAATMGAFNWAQVLRHEFTHTVTLAATDNRIAHWMTEGLAVLEERSPLRWEWVPMLYNAVKEKKLFTIEELTWGFVRPKKPSDRQLAYAQSYWLCKYIDETYSHEAILNMLAAFRRGRSQDEAIVGVLRKSVSEFESEFFAWTEKQVASWGYDEKTTRKVEDLKDEGEGLIRAKQYEKALEVWERVAKLRPMDQTPHMRLAALYLRAKRTDEAVKHLESLHAVELHDNRFAKRIARILRDEEQVERAVKYAVQAVYVDPYDVDAHELLEELYEKSGDESGASRERRVIEILRSTRQRNTG